MTRKLEWGVALAGTLVLVFLHVLLLQNAGALWRDEVNSVNLASLPWPQFWQSLQWDSFPVLWFVLLRTWTAIGLGSTDMGLRALGFLLGVGVVAALWRNARAFGIGPPLFSLALFGFCAAAVAYGDSVRAYGLGVLAGIMTFSLAWEFAEAPTLQRLVVFGVAAVLSVHCLFYNSLLLLAACAGGAAVAGRRRDWKTLLQIGGVGATSAVSLLLYRETIRNQKAWNAIVQWPIGPSWVWEKFVEATSSTWLFAHWVWVAFGLLAAIATVLFILPSARLPRRQRDLVLYSGTALAVGGSAYVLFLLKLSYFMQPWYFLSILALAACCFDGILCVAARPGFRLARAAGAAGLMVLALPGLWGIVHERKTNLDLVAKYVGASVAKGDFIVVQPWQCGITFSRYYRGPADWVTVPPVSSHDLHRYDFLKEAMMSPRVMAPVQERLREVMVSGHRVWWVGELWVPPDGKAPPLMPPAPQASWGWEENAHYQQWGMQLGYTLLQESANAYSVSIPSDRPVSPFEDLPVVVLKRPGAR